LHSIQTPWSTYLAALTTLSLSRDPLTDVRWAIPELDAIRFTALEKTDSVSIHEGQLEQVQNDTVPLAFRREEHCQIAHVLYVHTTAQLKDDLAVFFPGDPEHLSLFGVTARRADRRNASQFRLQPETIDSVGI
jgi:hypothetical protein